VADTVVVGRRAELDTRRVTLRDTVLHVGPAFDSVKLRYRQRPLPCRARRGPDDDGLLELELLEPASAAAPGQVGCLMAGELVVGHGTIA
jgi:tRNA U34 2-thiouridine synthase MnmA/TrmU